MAKCWTKKHDERHVRITDAQRGREQRLHGGGESPEIRQRAEQRAQLDQQGEAGGERGDVAKGWERQENCRATSARRSNTTRRGSAGRR